ncbi:uncharacterized protein RJT21DRAFT_103823 [Scheffersomyces amazonensis]|uniref:uncharacterized protein n=1 Tax=Scheffersomyces amazonensis TaxID=1078765 RepID=UPI00315D2EB2
MSVRIHVQYPAVPLTVSASSSTSVSLQIGPYEGVSPLTSEVIASVGVPVFTLDDEVYVLIKHLAAVWSFPSSYQLIGKLLKQSGIPKSDLVYVSTPALNTQFVEYKLIDPAEAKFNLFYTKLATVYSLIQNKEVFTNSNPQSVSQESAVVPVSAIQNQNQNRIEKDQDDDDDDEDDEDDDDDEDDEDDDDDDEEDDDDDDDDEIVVKKRKHHHHNNGYEKITVSQAFPQYGLVSSTIQLNPSAFNSLNPITKLNYYRLLSSPYKFLPNSKLSFAERELVFRDHNFSDIFGEGSSTNKSELKGQEGEKKRFRKPIGKSKKHNINIDPNTIDLSESVIPGQGYIPEFNINHLCKVPNYYVTSNQQYISAAAASTQSLFNLNRINATSNSSFLFNESYKMSKKVKQLIFNGDNDYHHTKYYYTKSYRGPGSGNYKDAALMNRINKIHVISNNNIKHPHKKSTYKKHEKRFNQSLKGLLFEKYNREYVDSVLSKQRKYTEDYVNLEMLHNNLQFNLLINSYREISEETWENYYKFKLTDFEQLKALQEEKKEIEIKKEEFENRKKWQENEAKRQEDVRKLIEQYNYDREQLRNEKIQRQKDYEEKKRQNELESTFNDPFGDGSSTSIDPPTFEDIIKREIELTKKFETDQESLKPVPPPMPVETPQLDVISRFTSPLFHPEIVSNLPLELRSNVQTDQDDIPPIKKPIRYVSTYPDKNNPELLNRVEIVKIPNPNSIGWDNLKKYKRD